MKDWDNFKNLKTIDPDMVTRMRKEALEKQKSSEEVSMSKMRTKVELLTGIGRLFTEVDIPNSDVKFTLRTLKGSEAIRIQQFFESFEKLPTNSGSLINQSSVNKTMVEILVYSIYKIDGIDVDVALNILDLSEEDQIRYKREFIEEMDFYVIQRLFSKYSDLKKESIDLFTPKTEKEMEEAVEAIKKSS